MNRPVIDLGPETIDTDAMSPSLRAAMEADKREGLLLAVRARWIALTVISVMLVFIIPRWEVLYYHALILGFAGLGWLQLRAGEVGLSRRELLILYADLTLMTVILLVPNPFAETAYPLPMQYHFGGFVYFYVLLAGATLAYSWRTVVAFGVWTSGLWVESMLLILWLNTPNPELTAELTRLYNGDKILLDHLDPTNVSIDRRVQDVVVFLIVAATLAVSSRRTQALLIRQSEAARERANLTRYFPPNLVDQLADRDQPLGAVREQEVAVMFVDIVGFTKLAEQHTPDQTVALLREFHARLERLVFEHGGTLDKFLGDGLMATFGTPEPGPRDASNAIDCAHAMLAEIDRWNGEREASGEPAIRLAIGLHHGPAVLGDLGTERRLEFAVIGDTVNVASRLENLTRELGVRLALSEELLEAARVETDTTDLDTLTDLGPRTLRGREKPVRVWGL